MNHSFVSEIKRLEQSSSIADSEDSVIKDSYPTEDSNHSDEGPISSTSTSKLDVHKQLQDTDKQDMNRQQNLSNPAGVEGKIAEVGPVSHKTVVEHKTDVDHKTDVEQSAVVVDDRNTSNQEDLPSHTQEDVLYLEKLESTESNTLTINSAKSIPSASVAPNLASPSHSHRLDQSDNALSQTSSPKETAVEVISTESIDSVEETAFGNPPDIEPETYEATVVSSVIASDTDELDDVKDELEAAQVREHRLDVQVHDLESQLKQQKEIVEQLRLDLEIIQTSKTELLAELAEAKRYILKLTNHQHSAEKTLTQPTLEKHPTGVQPPLINVVKRNNAVERSPQTPIARSTRQSQNNHHRQALRGANQPPSQVPSRGIKGLPPMSTEQLQLAPSQHTNHSKPQSSQPGKIQRSPYQPIIRSDRPIPEIARDPHSKVPKPKLSDAEISWFD